MLDERRAGTNFQSFQTEGGAAQVRRQAAERTQAGGSLCRLRILVHLAAKELRAQAGHQGLVRGPQHAGLPDGGGLLRRFFAQITCGRDPADPSLFQQDHRHAVAERRGERLHGFHHTR